MIPITPMIPMVPITPMVPMNPIPPYGSYGSYESYHPHQQRAQTILQHMMQHMTHIPTPLNTSSTRIPYHHASDATARGRFVMHTVHHLALLLALFLLLPQRAWADNWNDSGNYSSSLSGSGTAEDPYLIATAADLACLSKNINTYINKCVKVIADIDLSGHEWTPISNFRGTFDGGGHTISGMNASTTDAYAGFFAQAYGNTSFYPTIKNFTLKGTLSCTATLPPLDASDSSKTQPNNQGQAGVVGRAYGLTIEDVICYVDITDVTGQCKTGGIIGNASGGTADYPITVNRCAYYGTINITGYDCVGGIVGYNGSYHAITNCLYAGSITAGSSGATTNIGGILGYTNNANYKGIQNCLSIGSLANNSTTTKNTGAIAGREGSNVSSTKDNNNYYTSTTASAAYGKKDNASNTATASSIGSGKDYEESALTDGTILALLAGMTKTDGYYPETDASSDWTQDFAAAQANPVPSSNGFTCTHFSGQTVCSFCGAKLIDVVFAAAPFAAGNGVYGFTLTGDDVANYNYILKVGDTEVARGAASAITAYTVAQTLSDQTVTLEVYETSGYTESDKISTSTVTIHAVTPTYTPTTVKGDDSNDYSVAVKVGDQNFSDVTTGMTLVFTWKDKDGNEVSATSSDANSSTFTATNKYTQYTCTVTVKKGDESLATQVFNFGGKVIYLNPTSESSTYPTWLSENNLGIFGLDPTTFTTVTGYTSDAGYTIATGDDTNDGLTPITPVATWEKAYSLLDSEADGGSWDSNIIILMGQADNTYHSRSEGCGGTTYKDYINESIASKPATITGVWNDVDYQAVIRKYSVDQTNFLFVINAPHKLRNLTFTDAQNYWFIMLCHNNDLYIDEGVVMKDFDRGDPATLGGIDGSNTTRMHIFGGYNSVNGKTWYHADGTTTSAYSWSTTELQNYNHKDEGFTITIKSGCWGNISVGNRTGATLITSSPSAPVKARIVVDIDKAKNDVWQANALKNTKYKVTHDIGSILAGSHTCTAFADVDITIKSGRISRVVNGGLGTANVPLLDTDGSYTYYKNESEITSVTRPNKTVGDTKYFNPYDTFFGRVVTTIDPYDQDGDGDKNNDVVINEMYGAGMGRRYEGAFCVEVQTYQYGHNKTIINGGTFKDAIYGTGAGGVAGIGTKAYGATMTDKYNPSDTDIKNHTRDIFLPYYKTYNGTKYVVYGSDYEAQQNADDNDVITMTGFKDVTWNDDGTAASITAAPDINIRNTTSTLTINGGIFEGNIYGGGDGASNTISNAASTKTGEAQQIANPAVPNLQAGSIFAANTTDDAVTLTINGGTFYGDIYGGSKGSTNYYGENTSAGGGYINAYATLDGTTTVDYKTFVHFANITGNTVININANAEDDSKSPVIYGNVYAGGAGVDYIASKALTIFPLMARTNGNVTVNMNGGTVYGDIYGGGAKSQVVGNTYLNLAGGKFAGNVYGGGQGVKYGSGDVSTTVTMPADVSGYTLINNINHADIDGNTNVILSGAANIVDKRYIKGTGLVEWQNIATKADAMNDGNFWDKNDTSNDEDDRFVISHNVYGGGNTACTVTGNTNVVVSEAPLQESNTDGGFMAWDGVFDYAYTLEGSPHFSFFGGGYGLNTTTVGNAIVDFRPNSSNTKEFISTGASKNIGADAAFLPAQSAFDIVGGGFNGAVTGSTIVHIGGWAVIRNAYGGGYYGKVGGYTNVFVTSGDIDNVYGGSLMGDVSTAIVQVGLTSTSTGSAVDYGGWHTCTYASDEKLHNNSEIHILGSVYGGNDVSGTVTNAKVNIYGGEIETNVYGAGNGDYRGYYDPTYCLFADGENDNYYVNYKPGTDNETANVYKFRPHTTNVTLTIKGNSKDERVKIDGQVFGGGNSANIGEWDDNLRKAYADNTVTTYKTGKGYTDKQAYGTTEASVNDDPDYYKGGGTLTINIGSHVSVGKLTTVQDNVTGLFLGCNGHHLLTQNLLASDAYYHRYYYKSGKKYLPGFPVYNDGGTKIEQATGNEMFRAYCNNVLTNCDINLYFTDDPSSIDPATYDPQYPRTSIEDTEFANFVVGGYRGSLKKYTKNFYFNLPPGLTITNDIIGGSFNALASYLIYNTDGTGENYTTTTGKDADGNTVTYYEFKSTADDGETVDSYDYYGTDPTTGKDYTFGTTMNGIERYRFVGGILGGTPGAVLADNDTYLNYTVVHWKDDEDKKWDRKALVRLNLNCKLRPNVITDSEGNKTYFGGNIFGGCYSSGITFGDIWVGNSTSPADGCPAELSSLSSTSLALAQQLDSDHFVLRTYGAGYGKNTEVYGNTYVHLESDYTDTQANVFAFNSFGGSHEGTVFGSTHTEFLGDHDTKNYAKRNQLVGNIYGGGVQGDVLGNQNGSDSKPKVLFASSSDSSIPSYVAPSNWSAVDADGKPTFKAWGNCLVHIDGGLVTKAYGGAREANIDGGTHVYISESTAHQGSTIVSEVYGGNDRSGTIKGKFPLYYLGYTNGANTHEDYPYVDFRSDIESKDDYIVECPYTNTMDSTSKLYNTTSWPGVTCYVQVGGTLGTSEGYPIIGKIFAGGDGSNYSEGTDPDNIPAKPEVKSAMLDISGGTLCQAFGGGNDVTVTERNYIRVNQKDPALATYTAVGGSAGIALARYYTKDAPINMYTLSGSTFSFHYNIGELFGGNNLADMSIQPRWDLHDGKISDVYSGGNAGRMTYYNPAGVAAEQSKVNDPYATVDAINAGAPRGLSITIDHDDIEIGNLYGGCRIANVQAVASSETTLGTGDTETTVSGERRVTFPDGYYGATVNVRAGKIENVYGGNDVAGNVINGTNVNIDGAISGDVYGAGNGDYLYRYNKDITDVTEVVDDKYTGYGRYVELPTPTDATYDASTDIGKVQLINHWRPNVQKAYLNIFGHLSTESTGERFVYVKGNVYCGGNSSSIIGGSSTTKFDIGNNVVLNGVYMGSNGEHLAQYTYANYFKELNDINLNEQTVLNEFMKAVETDAIPENFTIDPTLQEAYIGTFCMGGNVGSMSTTKPASMTFPSNLTIFDKIIGGCNNATFTYGSTTFNGGYYNKNVDDATTADIDESKKPKIELNVFSKFEPHKMNVPVRSSYDSDDAYNTAFAAAKTNKFLNGIIMTSASAGYNTKANGKSYLPETCNIFGGCYSSGIVNGDVNVFSYANLLADLDTDTQDGETIITSAQKYEYLETTNALFSDGELIPTFSIFGGGYGPGTFVYGNTTVEQNSANNPLKLSKADAKPDSDGNYSGTWTKDDSETRTIPDYEAARTDALSKTASCNNIFGGGAKGNLVGHTTVNVFNGKVYTDVVGASYSGTIYGSTCINIGYSDFFETDQQATYQMKRSNDTDTELAYKNADNTPTIRQEIGLLVGEHTNKAVYHAIAMKDADDNKTGSDAQQSHFSLWKYEPTDWGSISIDVGKGVYGGGYATSGFSTASAAAGSYTVVPYTDGYNNDDNSINDYGGNATIFVADEIDALNWSQYSSADDRKEHIIISSRVVTSLGQLTAEQVSKMSARGMYYRGDIANGNAFYYAPESQLTTGKDYFTISGEGGIYGDGHKSLVKNVRTASIHGYGYAQHTPNTAQLLNTFQRLDLLRIEDCCIATFGARDFASSTDQGNIKSDDIDYSIARIGEMVMQSNISGMDAAALSSTSSYNSRNCINFYSPVWYLGGITSNVPFTASGTNSIYHDGTGAVQSGTTYYSYKNDNIKTNYDYSTYAPKDETAKSSFKTRNVGTAINMIRVNNGSGDALHLKHVREGVKSSTSDYEESYYGHIKGVCQIDLLSYDPDLGGGYVYAANKHEEKNSDSDATHNFLHSEGNFVFATGENVLGTETTDGRYIVDDCYSHGYGQKESASGGAKGTMRKTAGDGSSDDGCDVHSDEAHYWYVEGTKYIYSPTITGYTYDDGVQEFTTNDLVGVVTLLGMKKGTALKVKSIMWKSNHATDTDNPDYVKCDLENSTASESAGHANGDTNGTLIDSSKIPYRLKFSVSDTKGWSEDYQTYGTDSNVLTQTIAEADNAVFTTASSEEGKGLSNTPSSPILTIVLEDNVKNNGYNTDTDNYYTKYLSEPCMADIELEAEGDVGGTVTYLLYLTINYVGSPVVKGTLSMTCALPGEHIEIDASNVQMYRVEDMPYAGCTWKFFPSTANALNADGTPSGADTEGRTSAAAWENTGTVATFPARYFLNGGRVQMYCNFLNYPGTIPVLYHGTKADGTIDYDTEKTVLVHNYHNMQTELDEDYMMLYTAGARIYIKDRAGWEAFVKYCKRSDPANTYNFDDPDVRMTLTIDKVDYTTTWIDLDGDGVAETEVPLTAGMVKTQTDKTYGVNTYPWYCQGLKFYLQNDIDLSDADPAEVCIANKFLGQLDGDGYHVILPKGATSLFTDSGSTGGKAYNLVVVGGKTGLTNENCLENAGTTDADIYGKQAYDLSHFYSITGRADGTATDYANTDRYARNTTVLHQHASASSDTGYADCTGGDDWQYARVYSGSVGYNGDFRYLRLGEPNYLSTVTNHNTLHTAAETYEHDYRFFGQMLTAADHDLYPQHLDDEHDQYVTTYADADWTEENRVYGAQGYYRSEAGNDLTPQTDQGFYYNADAWVLNPKTLAVSWLNSTYDKPDDALTSFNLDSGITPNLLVYDGGYSESSFSAGTYSDETPESDIKYNHISGTSPSIDYLHLVDKEDFWAPVGFTVNQRAWYERQPEHYALQSNSAYEGIVLPFTVKKVSASVNGEITHFYGAEAATEGANDAATTNTGHEYWLRGMTSLSLGGSANETVSATFQRPGIFTDGKEKGSYTYSNTYLPDTYGDNYKTLSIYNDERTYADYLYQQHDMPYIVAFPGRTYREFDLSGEWNSILVGDTHPSDWDATNSDLYGSMTGLNTEAQTITYESTGTTTIAATGIMQTSAALAGASASTTYYHVGTFLNLSATADRYVAHEATTDDSCIHDGYGDGNGMTDGSDADNDCGKETRFVSNIAAMPFRTYLTTTNPAAADGDGGNSSGNAKRYILLRSTGIEQIGGTDPDSPAEEALFDGMHIYADGRTLCVDSDSTTTLHVYTTSGQLFRLLDIQEGQNRFRGFPPAVYVVGGKKVMIR